jgi:SAM-dependent methyltransferase
VSRNKKRLAKSQLIKTICNTELRLNSITAEGRQQIAKDLRRKYARVAVTPEGCFRYPTGEAGLYGQSYSSELLKRLHPDVLSSYCGVGNPFSPGEIREGESVLDIGCGAGVDTFIASLMTGPDGRVVGIDFIQKMVGRAQENLLKTDLGNVTFHEASAEELPFPDESFDVIISNGVFNLIPDKLKALKEALRVLKPSGRFMIADQVLTSELSDDSESRIDSWAS